MQFTKESLMLVRMLAAVLCLFAAAAFAQTDRGAITGTIVDPAGAVVATAGIEVKNLDTGIVYQSGASSTGNYVIQAEES